MGQVISLLSSGELKAYPSREEAPGDAATFSSPEELARQSDSGSLDHLRSKLLGSSVVPSVDVLDAARRLWQVLLISAEPQPQDRPRVKKKRWSSRVELLYLCWHPGEDRAMDAVVKRQCPQSKAILRILVDDGREIWTLAEATQALELRERELRTEQGVSKLFMVLRKRLQEAGIMEKVSYEEYEHSPRFENLRMRE
jgi:hypothetical protein